jgi:hypothetical protein
LVEDDRALRLTRVDTQVRYRDSRAVSQQESAEEAQWIRAHRAGTLIEQARNRIVPKMTAKQAGQAAGISGEWWAACVRGDRATGRGRRETVIAPDDTLVRMARVVSIEREVREVLGLEIPDRLVARQPGDDPDIEVTLRVPPEEYHKLTPEGRAYIDALVRRLAAEEHARVAGGAGEDRDG